MIWLKRSGWLLLVLFLSLAGAAGVYVARSFPALDGELKAPGLAAGVTVRRDGADVTHIHAGSARDAWFALGFVHAQERGWQLEFNRRLMHGQLSEVFGEATLETDKLLRALGIMHSARRQLAAMPADAREAVQAYADGINSFHAHGGQALPPEFHILGVQPGAWEPADSVGWTTMMALDLGGNWGTEFARLSAARVLDSQRLWQLFAPYPGEPPASRTDLAALYAGLGVYRAEDTGGGSEKPAPVPPRPALTSGLPAADAFAGMASWAADFSNNAGNVEGKGSNNWVVAGSHSTSGKPLLANDPHLGLSAPAVWYFARLQAPGLNVIGATLPGLPFVVLGRTEKVAWGFTNTGPDVQDLYLEQINPANPGQYRVPSADGTPAWAAFATRSETIKVKGRPDVALQLRQTRHGPVLSDVQKAHDAVLDLGKYVLALRWSALDDDNRTMVAAIKANRAASVRELGEAWADYHSPMQNVVMADVEGAIAYKAIGRAPLRHADNDLRGVAPSPGWEARYDWTGWIPYAQTPQDDGRKGWVATANQRIAPRDYPHFMGQDWATPNRFDRIEQLLGSKPRHDLADMQRIQGDELSTATQRLLPWLRKTSSTHPLAAAAQAHLKGFDGVMQANSAAALVFAAWADEMTRGLIAPRLGEARFKAMYGKRHFRVALEGVLERNDAWWCAPQSCAARSTAALDRALERLRAVHGEDVASWQWGRAHQALSAHRPFGGVPALARFFDVTVPTGGDPFSVNVGQYWPNDEKAPFANRHAASLRVVYDLAQPDESRFIYQTGQSGLVFSSRYRDMSQDWAGLRYRPLQMVPTEVRHTVTLLP